MNISNNKEPPVVVHERANINTNSKRVRTDEENGYHDDSAATKKQRHDPHLLHVAAKNANNKKGGKNKETVYFKENGPPYIQSK